MHDVEVQAYSPEAMEDGVAEFTREGRLIGYKVLQAGELPSASNRHPKAIQSP